VRLSEKPEVKAVRFGYPAPQNRTLHDKALQCMKEKVKLKLKARVKKKMKKKKRFWYPEPENRHCSALKKSWLDKHYSRVYGTIL